MKRKTTYADVWGDTVDVRHLSFAIVIGIVVSLSCYILGSEFYSIKFPPNSKKPNQGLCPVICAFFPP